MQRRGWLQLGAVTAVLAAGGTGWVAATWPQPRADDHFQPATADLLLGAGRAILDGLLPTVQPQAMQALQTWLKAMAATIAALPPATQAELDLLLAALTHPAARLPLTGSALNWATAPTDELQQLLQQLRTSALAERQQVYHGLRDLCTAAYLADAERWPLLGYPGPAFRFAAR